MPGGSTITPPVYPGSIGEGDLAFSKLMDAFVADNVYFGHGSYNPTLVPSIYTTTEAAKTELTNSFNCLGELAEKPGKADSKLSKLKTRNYVIPGKCTNTVELNIAGLSNNQKTYLESNDFMSKITTIVVASKDFDRVVIFNGLRWTVDWAGEADGLFNVTISSEFSGGTSDKIILLKDIPPRA
ncbi:MAG: hypothetical protein LHW60_08135 [Candidatus Cloacimonetes bacterium]|nr:hypothetical protein [Candidatus Cloacimonadota bacterium]